MSNPERSQYNNVNLTIDEDRVLTFSNIACPLDCKYCFSNDLIRGYENESGVYLSEEQFALLEQLPPEVTTIMLGCDTEFLLDKSQAIDVLERLSTMGKDLSVITKLPLSEEYVAMLAAVNNKLKENGNLLTFSVSIACTDSQNKWEPHVPSVVSRVETLRRAAAAGIDTMVAVRPLIPDVAESELDEIVDMTKDCVAGYYSGPLYLKELNEETLTSEKLHALRCGVSEEEEKVHWMPEGNRFFKIETPWLMAHLKDKIERSGSVLFEGAAEGMNYLKERNRAKS